jgi:hypothetical protein
MVDIPYFTGVFGRHGFRARRGRRRDPSLGPSRRLGPDGGSIRTATTSSEVIKQIHIINSFNRPLKAAALR